ncbi:MAG TPA: hydantoinase B/oxoprolinase family protein [Candidatus Dormibacteraeota bacterium]|nr:hydantoinase B/oxoprolinase family protein [Candidatus Dormibacteraeota bacterium]
MRRARKIGVAAVADPTQLEIFKNLFHSVAEEMGAALRRSAFSPNIKERRDYSCAVYNANGEVLAMGDHMPVHLGSMPASVHAVRSALSLEPGDMALLNDPFAGGTHLPDLTLVMPVYLRDKKQASFYVANRAHHADIGGALAGSMGPAREIFEEGLRIPPVKLFVHGALNRDLMSMLLANVRTPAERAGDLAAQIAACRIGDRRLRAIAGKYGEREVQTYGRHLLDYSHRMMTAALADLKPGTYAAEDLLDNDGITDKPLRIRVRVKIDNRKAQVDFAGSAPQCAGNVNAVEAIAVSAVYYVFRCLLTDDVPATSGLMRPIRVLAPQGSIVNAQPPAAVAGGNVETSQRMVDTLLRALAKAAPARIPAASQGTMNNLTLGGLDPRHNDAPFAYYETIAGGTGALSNFAGASAVHSHMTNSWNTPVEVFEQSYPVRVQQYRVRHGSGGAGRYRGGDGIVREIELLARMQIGLLSDRRLRGPYGLAGGHEGKKGRNQLIRNGQAVELPGKCAFFAEAGTLLRIETPGGGGWGAPAKMTKNK